MQNRTLASALLTFTVLIFCQASSSAVLAQSLFQRRSANQIDQYRDYVARGRGDILQILINESTDVENLEERSLDKSSDTSFAGDINYALGGGLGASIGSATVGGSSESDRAFSGDTEFRSERQFMDKFTVTVQDVLPNGNLVVSGTRMITVQGDSRELRLSGIVRQYDILPNNMVPSQMVGNLKIQLDAQGAEQAFSNQGWLSRRFNKWWPF